MIDTEDDDITELAHQDKNVIHCVGGYVIHHLKKEGAYQCFCDIEVATRKYLKVDETRDMNEIFKEKITTAILSNEDLLFNWAMAVGYIDQNASDKCLSKIVEK